MLATFNAVLPSVPSDAVSPVVALDAPIDATGLPQVPLQPFGELLAEATETSRTIETETATEKGTLTASVAPQAADAPMATSTEAPVDFSLGCRPEKLQSFPRRDRLDQVATPFSSKAEHSAVPATISSDDLSGGENQIEHEDVDEPASKSSITDSALFPLPLPAVQPVTTPVLITLALPIDAPRPVDAGIETEAKGMESVSLKNPNKVSENFDQPDARPQNESRRSAPVFSSTPSFTLGTENARTTPAQPVVGDTAGPVVSDTRAATVVPDPVVPRGLTVVASPVAVPVMTKPAAGMDVEHTATASTKATVSSGKPATQGAPAQIASHAFSFASAATVSASYKIKNTFQVTDKEVEAKQDVAAGIVPATTGPVMTPNSNSFAQTTVTSVSLAKAVAPAPATETTKATEAVRLLERVAEAADHLASHPSERVTVRIELDDTSRVDIHVSMRGGRLQADFRTESVEMRQALSAAWSGFTAARAENSTPWADPVFAALAVPAHTTVQPTVASAENTGGFSFDADRGSRRQENARPEARLDLAPARPSVGGDHADVTEPVALPRLTETSRHLSLFA